MFKPSKKELLLFALQIAFVASIVAITFSYKVDTELELPYQVGIHYLR